MKILHRTFLFGLLLSVVVLGACSSGQTSVETDDEAVINFNDLVGRLQANDANVETNGTVSQPFFTPEGQIIAVNGQDVQVFEYDSEAAANAEADLVSPDGSSVGTSMMSWMATPHFYKSGKLIVLYVGDQAATIELLEEVLGAQFAGG